MFLYGFYFAAIFCVKTYEADLLFFSFPQESIQQETHDSIEDAVTALKLWRKWQEYEDAGVVETMLNDVYSRGSMVGFKAPAYVHNRLWNAEEWSVAEGGEG